MQDVNFQHYPNTFVFICGLVGLAGPLMDTNWTRIGVRHKRGFWLLRLYSPGSLQKLVYQSTQMRSRVIPRQQAWYV